MVIAVETTRPAVAESDQALSAREFIKEKWSLEYERTHWGVELVKLLIKETKRRATDQVISEESFRDLTQFRDLLQLEVKWERDRDYDTGVKEMALITVNAFLDGLALEVDTPQPE